MEEFRVCIKCNKEKSVELDFYPLNDGGPRARCKACMSEDHKDYIKRKLEIDPDYNRNKQKKYNDSISTRKVRRKYQIKKVYGLTVDQYESMLLNQEGMCGVCKLPLGERPVIDHCHETGKVREILHYGCNTAVGLLKDSPEICRMAALYLEKHGRI